jgi:SAM-dependent methyltransferase
MTDPHEWVTESFNLRNKRDIEEMQTDTKKATSANAFSWIVKGNITMRFASSSGEVLDVGCGWGRELTRLKDAVGIDVCLPFLKTARNYTSNPVILADAHFLPFRDDSFDFIVISEVIEHLAHPVKVIGELKRVLRQRGKLLVQTPNKLLTRGAFIHPEKCGHVHEFTFSELVGLLNSSGFEVLQREGSTIPYIPSTNRFEGLNHNIVFFSLWKMLNRLLPLRWDVIVLSRLKSKKKRKDVRMGDTVRFSGTARRTEP